MGVPENNVWLEGIPIPPSLNMSYPTGKHGRRFKSRELVSWERDFQTWSFLNMPKVREARVLFSARNNSEPISVKLIFYFLWQKVYCKNGRPKRCDLDNRLKHSIDQVSKLLGFDDSLIFHISCQKTVTPSQIEFYNMGLRWVSPTHGN